MVEFSIANKTYSVTRPKLRKWIATENYRNSAEESVDRNDDSGFVSGINSFLSTLVSISTEEVKAAPWYEVAEAYYLASVENMPKLDLSIIQSSKKDHIEKIPDAWEYDERTWYAWLHLLAANYNWNIEYIAELDVDDALALIQEISLQDQFDREWQYGLSEIAYEYDKGSGKSRLRALNRPAWMSRATHAVKEKIEHRQAATAHIKTPKSFAPPGLVMINGQNINTNEPTGDSTSIPPTE